MGRRHGEDDIPGYDMMSLCLPLDVLTFLQSLFSYANRIQSHDKDSMPQQYRVFWRKKLRLFLLLPTGLPVWDRDRLVMVTCDVDKREIM